MLDGLQPQKLDAGALSVGALARLMREERQRQPDKKIHLVLDDRAAEAVGWAGGAALAGSCLGCWLIRPEADHCTSKSSMRAMCVRSNV